MLTFYFYRTFARHHFTSTGCPLCCAHYPEGAWFGGNVYPSRWGTAGRKEAWWVWSNLWMLLIISWQCMQSESREIVWTWFSCKYAYIQLIWARTLTNWCGCIAGVLYGAVLLVTEICQRNPEGCKRFRKVTSDYNVNVTPYRKMHKVNKLEVNFVMCQFVK